MCDVLPSLARQSRQHDRQISSPGHDIVARSLRHVLGLEPLAGGARQTAIGIAQHGIRGAIDRPALFFGVGVHHLAYGKGVLIQCALPRL